MTKFLTNFGSLLLNISLAQKSAHTTERHDIPGGKAIILRTAQSGKVWQFRMWVAEEKKYVRKTLKTRDFKTAVQRAEEEYLRLYSDIASGRKLFGITLGELAEQYLKWREKDVAGGSITAGRLVTIASQLKHVRNYKGADTGISELDRNSSFDYGQWRRVDAGAKDVTCPSSGSLRHGEGPAKRGLGSPIALI